MNSLKYESKEKESDNDGCCKPYGGNSFPEVHLRGNQVTALTGGRKMEPGEVYEGPFQFKVASWSEPEDSENGEPTISIRLVGCDSLADATETDEDPAAE